MKPRQNGFEPNGIRQAGGEGHVGSPSSVRGLKIGIPSGAKSFVLQVASTSAWASAVVGRTRPTRKAQNRDAAPQFGDRCHADERPILVDRIQPGENLRIWRRPPDL
jgi:hypothetical protein